MATNDTRPNTHYLAFTLVEYKTTTCVWSVRAILTEKLLGEVRWNAKWRKYVFHPENGSLFDSTCLNEIRCFINRKMTRDSRVKEKEEIMKLRTHGG